MKIVILDGYTENPGDLSWDWLNEYGEFTLYDRTSNDKILQRCEGFDAIITNKTPLTKETLAQLPDLKFVALSSTGTNIADWEYCKEKGIPVCNVPSYSTEAVAQCVFAHILNYTNSVATHSDSVHRGDWARSVDFCYQIRPIWELKDKVLGIIGFGETGKAVAGLALAFGMKVLANTNSPKEHKGVKFVDKDELTANSDFISLHCPLNASTENMVDEKFLSKMKKSAMLINTSRGPVVNEAALANALKNKEIAAAGLDVLSKEPPDENNPLFGLENCSITPHTAWAGFETRARLMEILKENFKGFATGNIINCVY